MDDTVPHAESADPGEAAEADHSDGEVVINTGPSEVATLPHTTEEVNVDGSKDPKPEIGEAKEEENRSPPDTCDNYINYLGHLGTEDTNMTLVNITAFEQTCSGNGQEGDTMKCCLE